MVGEVEVAVREVADDLAASLGREEVVAMELAAGAVFREVEATYAVVGLRQRACGGPGFLAGAVPDDEQLPVGLALLQHAPYGVLEDRSAVAGGGEQDGRLQGIAPRSARP